MSNPNNYAAYSDEQLDIIHAASEKFESALQSDSPYRIEELLDAAPSALRQPLLRELLAIKMQWRASRATLPPMEDYLKRFPKEELEVRRLYDEAVQAKRESGCASKQSSSVPLPAGTLVANRYTIVELIGEGGMGSVYLAEQSQPMRRQVALKLIKGGMDSQSVLRRFDAERQALAIMDHPSIAKVYDGGTGLHGQPYFAMELVRGLPITEYCDNERLSVRERLKLFVQVTEAVQHAHMKGIIHRDLKPANLLVATLDGRPHPKVIDFGVAKAMEQNLSDQSTAATAFIVGTPAYMSPEQADPTTTDIDTRTDVYSLGVILFELLVGSPPHELRSSQGGKVAELLQLVRDADSPRPSSKLSEAKELPKIAADRSTEPQRLTYLLRSELDWIVLKALARDRNQRYKTANALARDVDRYLAGEIVEAQPPSAKYRLKKIATRYKRYVIAGSLLVLVLLSGMIGTAWGLLEAKKQYALAKTEAREKEKALQNESRERAYAEAIADFVVRDFLALTTLEGRLDFDAQDSGLTKDSTLQDLLDRASVKLDGRSDLDPRADARLRWMIGRSFYLQGEYSKAIDAFQRSHELYLQVFGPDNLSTLNAQDGLAKALHWNGKYDLARPLIEDSLKRKTVLSGVENVETLNSMSLQALNLRKLGEPEKAAEIFERTLKLRKSVLGPEAHDTLTNMYDLTLAYRDLDQRSKALTLLEQTLALQKSTLGLENPDTNTSLALLATFYREAGKFEKALPLMEQDLSWTKANYGEEHPKVIFAVANLAACYRDSGKTDLAIQMSEQAYEMVQKTFGPEHPNAANAMSSLAMAYRAAGDHEKALPYFEKTLGLRKKAFEPKHPNILASMVNLAACYRSLNRNTEAQDLTKRCLELSTEIHGADHRTTLTTMGNLAFGFFKNKQLDLSIPLFEKVLAATEAKNGRTFPETLLTVANLGVNYSHAERYDEAIPLLEEAYAASLNLPSLSFTGVELIVAYLRAGKTDQAEKQLREVVVHTRKTFPENSVKLANQFATIGQVLLRSKAFNEAEPILRECLAIRQEAEPNRWIAYSTQSMLGQVQLGLDQLEAAESNLLAAYDGLHQQASTAPANANERIEETVKCLIDLYTRLKNETEAKRWQGTHDESLPAHSAETVPGT